MADLEDHFDDANPWNRVTAYMEEGTVLPVKVEGIVNGGAIAMVEGLRGFVPASKLSLSYIEDLETYLLQRYRSAGHRRRSGRTTGLVLSARELLKEKERKAKEEKIASICRLDAVMDGYRRQSLQTYGAFVQTGRRSFRTGTHFSDQSRNRIKSPDACLECRR